jgi:K+-transporting ATPase ATPase C chain
MLSQLRRSIVFSVILLVVFGILYPLVATGVSQVLFTHQASGSLTANGSTLIGQNWSQTVCPGHLRGSCVFQGRPDDLGPYAANPKKDISGGDNPLQANGVSGESGASNLGPRSETLVDNTKALVAYWRARGVTPTADLVTTSASGLDPDISPADATAQIPMVSRATGVPASRLRQLITSQTHGPQLGFLGAPYIVVLQLNEALAHLT